MLPVVSTERWTVRRWDRAAPTAQPAAAPATPWWPKTCPPMPPMRAPFRYPASAEPEKAPTARRAAAPIIICFMMDDLCSLLVEQQRADRAVPPPDPFRRDVPV